MDTNISKGKYGEQVAKKYLMNEGYKIIEMNFTSKIGEIDIIALDADMLVFIEVKTRSNKNFGYAFEAVNYKKQMKIINLSNLYIKFKKLKNIQIRYDIIEVYLEEKKYINHIKDAFRL